MIWSDEVPLTAGRDPRQSWVTRRAGEQYNPAFTKPQTSKYVEIMAWDVLPTTTNHPLYRFNLEAPTPELRYVLTRPFLERAANGISGPKYAEWVLRGPLLALSLTCHRSVSASERGYATWKLTEVLATNSYLLVQTPYGHSFLHFTPIVNRSVLPRSYGRLESLGLQILEWLPPPICFSGLLRSQVDMRSISTGEARSRRCFTRQAALTERFPDFVILMLTEGI